MQERRSRLIDESCCLFVVLGEDIKMKADSVDDERGSRVQDDGYTLFVGDENDLLVVRHPCMIFMTRQTSSI